MSSYHYETQSDLIGHIILKSVHYITDDNRILENPTYYTWVVEDTTPDDLTNETLDSLVEYYTYECRQVAGAVAYLDLTDEDKFSLIAEGTAMLTHKHMLNLIRLSTTSN